jgi:hypothetical protein
MTVTTQLMWNWVNEKLEASKLVDLAPQNVLLGPTFGETNDRPLGQKVPWDIYDKFVTEAALETFSGNNKLYLFRVLPPQEKGDGRKVQFNVHVYHTPNNKTAIVANFHFSLELPAPKDRLIKKKH